MSKQIAIGNNSTIYFGRVAQLLPQIIGTHKHFAVTDKKVLRHHPELFENMPYATIGQGEKHKTLKSVGKLYIDFIEQHLDRNSLILGIGGGIVTDVAGFATATYMRGVDFGAVPTTLLAQVDASVGGKTGVNIDRYKNMAGVFAQPRFVICDVGLLNTLPNREFVAGMAEVIKAAIIGDEELFDILERNNISTLRQDPATLEWIIYRAVKVKAEIVSRDERESGERRLLNLGHTMAHAIERCCAKVNHGEAVAIGIAMATRVAMAQGRLDADSGNRIEQLLLRYGLSINNNISIEQLIEVIHHDKKADNDSIWFIQPRRIGECHQVKCNFRQLIDWKF